MSTCYSYPISCTLQSHTSHHSTSHRSHRAHHTHHSTSHSTSHNTAHHTVHHTHHITHITSHITSHSASHTSHHTAHHTHHITWHDQYSTLTPPATHFPWTPILTWLTPCSPSPHFSWERCCRTLMCQTRTSGSHQGTYSADLRSYIANIAGILRMIKITLKAVTHLLK